MRSPFWEKADLPLMIMIKKRKSVEEYKAGVLTGNRAVLAQAITLVESNLRADSDLASALVQEILPYAGNSIRIGITGVPGVGKSTFIEAFGRILLDQGKKVAVLAVDPSSQKTGGSILGDKTRMEKLAADRRAFIRPSPSGTTLGGVSSKTRESMLICEAAGFDVILVETVGVGQSETAVKGMVDFFLLLMLAGAGDELQGIKKGIMEMADGILINKADGDTIPAAKRAKNHYQNALHLFPPSESGWYPSVAIGSSLTGDGLFDCWKKISEYQNHMVERGLWNENRAKQRLNWLDESIQSILGKAFLEHPEIQKRLPEGKEAVKNGTLNPIAFAKELTGLFFKK